MNNIAFNSFLQISVREDLYKLANINFILQVLLKVSNQQQSQALTVQFIVITAKSKLIIVQCIAMENPKPLCSGTATLQR